MNGLGMTKSAAQLLYIQNTWTEAQPVLFPLPCRSVSAPPVQKKGSASSSNIRKKPEGFLLLSS